MLDTMDTTEEALTSDKLRQKLNRTMTRCRNLEDQVVTLQREITSIKANHAPAIPSVSAYVQNCSNTLQTSLDTLTEFKLQASEKIIELQAKLIKSYEQKPPLWQ